MFVTRYPIDLLTSLRWRVGWKRGYSITRRIIGDNTQLFGRETSA